MSRAAAGGCQSPAMSKCAANPSATRRPARNRARRSGFRTASNMRSRRSEARAAGRPAVRWISRSPTNMRSSRTCTFPAMVSSAPDLTSRLLRRERLIVAIGVALLALLSWWFVAAGAGMPDSMGAETPPFGALVLMWWLMMMAMMLPSAVPAILLYARVRQAWNNGPAIAQSWIFLCGYLLVWLLFSIGAAIAQRLSIGASMALDNRYAEGALLLAA